jgi:DNA-binding GntR family transcriptional regulator
MKTQQPTTKVAYAYEAIRKDILGGTYVADQRLRLAEMAKHYDVSVLPVREALRMLERDGLVTIMSHRGAVVSRLSLARAIEHIEVRSYLEIYAAVLAAPAHNAATIAGLRALIKRSRVAAKAGQGKKFSQLNRDFHTQLYEPGPNLTLKSEITELWNKVWRTVEFQTSEAKSNGSSIFDVDRNRMRGALAEHTEIVDSIEAGDLARVEAAMNEHRNQTLSSWRAFAAQTPSDS